MIAKNVKKIFSLFTQLCFCHRFVTDAIRLPESILDSCG